MDVKIKSASFKSSYPISVLSFLKNFKTGHDINGIHGGAAIRLFERFMNDSCKVALAHGVCATEEPDPRQEGEMTI